MGITGLQERVQRLPVRVKVQEGIGGGGERVHWGGGERVQGAGCKSEGAKGSEGQGEGRV